MSHFIPFARTAFGALFHKQKDAFEYPGFMAPGLKSGIPKHGILFHEIGLKKPDVRRV